MEEFQRAKLGALLDLYSLYDRADGRLYHAPWREELRQIDALLQGAYAHLAVSEHGTRAVRGRAGGSAGW